MSESRRGTSLRRKLVLVLILLVLLPVVFAGTVLASILLIPATAPNTYDEYRAEIGDEIRALMRAHGVPGAAVALVHDGEIWVQGYGSADTERGLPVTDGTVFQAASVSKSVSAWGVMALVEEGRLELDAPISRYLNRWELPPSPYDESGVTVRRLLSHTAGLSVGGYLGYEPTTDLPSLEDELSVGEDAAERPGGVRLVYPPGSESRYSGGGFTLLQLLVEEVTGRPFSEHMEREVLGPLGMTDSTFEWGPPVEEAIATPYGEDGSVLPQYRLVAQAAGGLLTTAPTSRVSSPRRCPEAALRPGAACSTLRPSI
jgi:CubicO group peptidase (beta-lactamase class C family)